MNRQPGGLAGKPVPKIIDFGIAKAITPRIVGALSNLGWTAQQIINAFPYDTAPEYLLRDKCEAIKNVK